MRGIADDDGAARGLDSLRRFHEHVPAQEGTELRLAGELLELAQDCGLVVHQGALALAPYRVDQSFAMQRGADDAGGRLERQELGFADGTSFAVSDEPDDPNEFPADEDRDERFGIVRGGVTSRRRTNAALRRPLEAS